MIKALLFDKDGTLLDFDKTWGAWARGFLWDLAKGDTALFSALTKAVRLNPETETFFPDSPLIAGTADVAVDLMLPLLPNWTGDALLDHANRSSSTAPIAEVVPLAGFLRDLQARGLVTGIATNDAEANAITNMDGVEATEFLDHIIGYDSGYGAKPGPGMCLGFAERTGIAPQNIGMVGDSLHDLHAGRAAGMTCIGVLTGPASRDDLTPHADHVFDSIAELPAWLGRGSLSKSTQI